MSKKMKRFIQNLIQIVFLSLFLILIVKGKVQIWMAIFLFGLAAGIFFGRFYCGWLCPINTVTRAVAWIKNKLGVRDLHIPGILKSTYIKYGFLAAFIGLFIFVMASGRKLPILPSMIIAGAVITVLFSEELWHKYLCPYGTILGITSKKPANSLIIDAGKCINCGICMKECPAGAVEKSEKHVIDNSLCLICMDCVYKCPKDAIGYGHQQYS